MFFVGNILNNQIGVVDTKDSVLEYYNLEELLNMNVQIEGVCRNSGRAFIQCPSHILNEADYDNFKSKQAFKLYRAVLKGDFADFMSNHYVFGISDMLFQNGFKLNGLLKWFNYSETDGFIVLVLSVHCIDVYTLMLVRITEYGNLISIILGKTPLGNYNWFVGQNPIGSGTMFSIAYDKDLLQRLNPNRIYMKINYTNDNFILYNVSNFESTYLR